MDPGHSRRDLFLLAHCLSAWTAGFSWLTQDNYKALFPVPLLPPTSSSPQDSKARWLTGKINCRRKFTSIVKMEKKNLLWSSKWKSQSPQRWTPIKNSDKSHQYLTWKLWEVLLHPDTIRHVLTIHRAFSNSDEQCPARSCLLPFQRVPALIWEIKTEHHKGWKLPERHEVNRKLKLLPKLVMKQLLKIHPCFPA